MTSYAKSHADYQNVEVELADEVRVVYNADLDQENELEVIQA